MSAPMTLRRMAGAPDRPASLAEAALVVIDAQREYGPEGRLPLAEIAPALTALADLLAAARKAGTPIIHVAHKGPAGGLFDREGTGGRFLAEAEPMANEAVVEKSLPNSFAGTDLKDRLGASGRRPLILAGFMTHMCVSSTARAALDLGLPTTIAFDATATRALPDPTGGEAITASILQRAALAELADRFAVVASARAIIEAI